MNKKVLISIFAVVLVLITTGTVLALNHVFSLTSTGSKMKDLLYTGKSTPKIQVYDIVITQEEIQAAMLLNQAMTDMNKKHIEQNTMLTQKEKQDSLETTVAKTEQETIDSLIRQSVLAYRAKEQGFTATRKEAEDYLQANSYEAIMALYPTIEDPDQKKQYDDVLNIYNSFLKGLGMTHEEYREYQIPIVCNMLAIEKAKDQLVSQYKAQGISDQKQIESEYEKYVKNVIESAPISDIQ